MCGWFLSDLLSILRGNIKCPFGAYLHCRYEQLNHLITITTRKTYLRFEVKDKQGVLSLITNVY